VEGTYYNVDPYCLPVLHCHSVVAIGPAITLAAAAAVILSSANDHHNDILIASGVTAGEGQLTPPTILAYRKIIYQ